MNFKKYFFILTILFLSNVNLFAQITLTHNIGNIPIKTNMTNCEYDENWARAFTLTNFGIATTDQFIIRSAQVAISNSYNGARMLFTIYSIDSNFPNSTPKFIGNSLILAHDIGDTPEIVQIDFSTPIVIPALTEKILVEVTQMDDIYNPNYKKAIIAGTKLDNDTSWFRGCREYYTYTSTENLSTPVPDANFFINVTGDIFNTQSSGLTTRLSHSDCDYLTKPQMYGCSTGGMSWSRDFILSDFGISTDEEFIIDYAQVGLSYAHSGVEIQFRIYAIDENFPSSFSESNLLGSSDLIPIPYFGALNYNSARIFDVNFDTPILVPANVERILVEVYQTDFNALPAGTEQDTGITWVRSYSGGCYPYGEFKDVNDVWYENPRVYITVTGDSRRILTPFNMNITNICQEFLKEFSITNSTDINTVSWNFGDPASGTDNTSTDLSPFHDFSADGVYTVTATILANDGHTESISETIDVKEPPNAYGINNIYACEDNYGTGISSSFDVSQIESQVLGGQLDKVVTCYDSHGNELPNPLPNFLTNTIKERETITVRVAHKDILCCYSETTFDLIVQPLPQANQIDDLYSCSNSENGYAYFDLAQLIDSITGSEPNVSILFFNQNGDLIPNTDLSNYKNSVTYKETIIAKVTDINTNCYNETAFDIIVNEPPIANELDDLMGCDDNADGISEYFDISNVESSVLNGQLGLEVTYYNDQGDQIQFTNPYTNVTPNTEIINVRVTNPQTKCFAETSLTLKTSLAPNVKRPSDIYSCDQGDGFSIFDLSDIRNEIIGNQASLKISYFSSNGEQISLSQLSNYENTTSYHEIINIRVENERNPLCSSEVELNLYVSGLPEINLESSYLICDSQPGLNLVLPQNYYGYSWRYQDGNEISNTNSAYIVDEGNYNVTVEKLENGIVCNNTFLFGLIRSKPPIIKDVNSGNFGENYIEVNVINSGNFEYSINGIDYQDSNRFNNLFGGDYTVYVRDKNDCGIDSKEVSILDYIKFFSPNNDGINDTWGLQGVDDKDYKLYIFNRFGKVLKELNPIDNTWDGYYNGTLQPPDDYWFKVTFNDGVVKAGHFALLK